MVNIPVDARFAIIRTAFHGGGTVGFYSTFREAEKAVDARKEECICGCMHIVPVTMDAREEYDGYDNCLAEWIWAFGLDSMPILYADFPAHNGHFGPRVPCR